MTPRKATKRSAVVERTARAHRECTSFSGIQRMSPVCCSAVPKTRRSSARYRPLSAARCYRRRIDVAKTPTRSARSRQYRGATLLRGHERAPLARSRGGDKVLASGARIACAGLRLHVSIGRSRSCNALCGWRRRVCQLHLTAPAHLLLSGTRRRRAASRRIQCAPRRPAG